MDPVVAPEQRPGGIGVSETSLGSVALIDDHPVFTGALASVLAGQTDVAEVRTAATLADARRLLASQRPDLAVVDVRLDGDDGLTMLSELPSLSPSTKAVVLTAHPQPAVVKRARALGARAILPKGMDLPELLSALRRVIAGELIGLDTEPDEPGPALTWRETEVLQLLADGRDPQQAARLLDLSTHTVRDHIRSAREKLGVQTVLAAVVEAARLGVIELPVR